jgi:hypothetical protein
MSWRHFKTLPKSQNFKEMSVKQHVLKVETVFFCGGKREHDNMYLGATLLFSKCHKKV